MTWFALGHSGMVITLISFAPPGSVPAPDNPVTTSIVFSQAKLDTLADGVLMVGPSAVTYDYLLPQDGIDKSRWLRQWLHYIRSWDSASLFLRIFTYITRWEKVFSWIPETDVRAADSIYFWVLIPALFVRIPITALTAALGPQLTTIGLVLEGR